MRRLRFGDVNQLAQVTSGRARDSPEQLLGIDSRTYILENREDERNKIVNVKALWGTSVSVDGVLFKKSGSLVGVTQAWGREEAMSREGQWVLPESCLPPKPLLPLLWCSPLGLTSPLLGPPGVPAGKFLGTPCCVSGAADGPAGLDPGALGTVVFHQTPNCDPRCSRP